MTIHIVHLSCTVLFLYIKTGTLVYVACSKETYWVWLLDLKTTKKTPHSCYTWKNCLFLPVLINGLSTNASAASCVDVEFIKDLCLNQTPRARLSPGVNERSTIDCNKAINHFIAAEEFTFILNNSIH